MINQTTLIACGAAAIVGGTQFAAAAVTSFDITVTASDFVFHDIYEQPVPEGTASPFDPLTVSFTATHDFTQDTYQVGISNIQLSAPNQVTGHDSSYSVAGGLYAPPDMLDFVVDFDAAAGSTSYHFSFVIANLHTNPQISRIQLRDFTMVGDGYGTSNDWRPANVTLTVVPEPSVAALFGGAGLAAAGRRRRRAIQGDQVFRSPRSL